MQNQEDTFLLLLKFSIRLVVDTGATMVTLSYEDAKRLNIDTNNKMEPITIATANGISTAYKIKLNRFLIGSIALSNIDAAIVLAKSNKLEIGLLGMSFLNRMIVKKRWHNYDIDKKILVECARILF